MRSRGTEADGGRSRDLIEAGLSEAASRLSAMAKVSSSSPPLTGQDPGGGRAVVCGVLAAGAFEHVAAASKGSRFRALQLKKGLEQARGRRRPWRRDDGRERC